MNWREYVDAFLGRGNYDPTGRDQEIARLRAEVERLAAPGVGPPGGRTTTGRRRERRDNP